MELYLSPPPQKKTQPKKNPKYLVQTWDQYFDTETIELPTLFQHFNDCYVRDK